MTNTSVAATTVSTLNFDPVNLTMLSSTVASMLTMSLAHPFEVTKIGQQLSFGNFNFGLKHANLLYYSSGLSALNVAIMTKNILRFPLYNQIIQFLERDNISFHSDNYYHHLSVITTASTQNILIAGGLTGFLESCFYIPFENLKSRMVGNSIILSERQQNLRLSNSPFMLKRRQLYVAKQVPLVQNIMETYRLKPSINFFTSFKEICQTDGLKGFFRGTLPTSMKFSCNSMINFGCYSLITEQLVSHHKQNTFALSLLTTLTCSSMIILLTQPLDFVKTRTQSNRFGPFYYSSLSDCIKKVYKEESIAAFYKGWFPRFIKVNILNFGIHLGIYTYLETAINMN
ncbi:hypothetical protein QEN19_000931 [Hanseniaspora menglaensis]